MKKPQGVEAEWDGSQWQPKPSGADSEWDGRRWQIRPPGAAVKWSVTRKRWLPRPGPKEKWRWDGSTSEWKRVYSSRDKKLIGTGIAVAALLVLGTLGYFLAQINRNATFAAEFAASEMKRQEDYRILEQMADIGVLDSQAKASRELRAAWVSVPSRPMATKINPGKGRHCIEFISSDGAVAHAVVTFKNVTSEIGYGTYSYRDLWTRTGSDIAGGGC